MKIIATIDSYKYLAEVDVRELRELNSDVKIEVGAEYEITKAAETLAMLRNLSRNKLEYIGRNINDLRETFEKIEQAYNTLMIIDRLKNSDKNE